MLIWFNLDDDIRTDMERTLDIHGDWFIRLPVNVQMEKLAPYVKRQSERDTRKFGLKAA